MRAERAWFQTSVRPRSLPAVPASWLWLRDPATRRTVLWLCLGYAALVACVVGPILYHRASASTRGAVPNPSELILRCSAPWPSTTRP